MALAIDGDIFQDAYPASLNPESEIYLILKIGGGCFVDRPDGELTVKTCWVIGQAIASLQPVATAIAE